MPRFEQITCSSCGTEKRESNHWFTVYPSRSPGPIAYIYKMEDCPDGGLDLCGESCVIKKVSELLRGKP